MWFEKSDWKSKDLGYRNIQWSFYCFVKLFLRIDDGIQGSDYRID